MTQDDPGERPTAPVGLVPQPSTGTRRGPPAAAHAATFLVLLGLWTWKLVSPVPVPEELRSGLESAGLSYAAAKTLHLLGYAVLAVLAGTLPVTRHWQRLLIGFLALHGVATEVAQTFVPNRSGRVTDVLIDWAGITVGAVAARWWNRRVTTDRP